VFVNETPVRRSPESELLQKAIAGDTSAIESLVDQLSSPYPRIKQNMLEEIHHEAEDDLWLNLLNCLASGKWSEELPLGIYTDHNAAQRLDISIVEAFLEDWSDEEKDRKNTILHSAITVGNISLRNAAAYLAGERGDAEAIPILAEMLDRGSRRWQLRAIRALSAIPDAKSAELLVRVLIDNHDIYHQEARLGLSKLGSITEVAWQVALGHSDPHIRWHAARGLVEIGNLKGIAILADALGDENSSVRWVSSDLLARVGVQAVPSILDIIVRKPFSDECRQSAHHALISMKTYRAQECLKPLVSALSSPSTKLVAQIIADRMRQDWNRLEMYISGRLQSLDQIN
jgi:HEAT repeat protein